MNQTKDIRITVRLTPEQYESICARAETAQMTPSTYIRAAAMRHKVVVVDGLKEFTHEMKGIGRNLNQLAIRVHEGTVTAPKLDATFDMLEKIYERLGQLTEQEKR